MNRQLQSGQISAAVILIGIGIVAVFGWWWPGIMFVIGAALIAQSLAEGKSWYMQQGALWVIGIGVLGLFNWWWPGIMFLVAASVLLGRYTNAPFAQSFAASDERIRTKRKNDDPRRNAGIDDDEEDEDAPGTHYELGDDGEMVKVKNDQKPRYSSSQRSQ